MTRKVHDMKPERISDQVMGPLIPLNLPQNPNLRGQQI